MKPPPRPTILNSTLLVRRVGSDAVDPVRRLLASEGPERRGSDQLVEVAARGGVFALGDVALSPGALPVAVALFEPDRSRGAARLEYVLVSPGWRGTGLARRLIGEAAVLLCADGLDLVEAPLGASSDLRLFLESIGFRSAGANLMVFRG